VTLWNVRDGSRRELYGGLEWFFSVSISPDGRHVAAGDSGGILWIWDARTGQLATICDLGLVGGSLEVSFTPDGKSVAAGGALWDFDPVGDILSGRHRTDDLDIPSRLNKIFGFNDSKLGVCVFSCGISMQIL
jgi:WD40 repeat protein